MMRRRGGIRRGALSSREGGRCEGLVLLPYRECEREMRRCVGDVDDGRDDKDESGVKQCYHCDMSCDGI